MVARSRSILLLSVCLAMSAAPRPVLADTFLKSVMRTGPLVIMGQEMPGQADTSKTWIGGDRAYQDHGDGTAALYLAADSLYYLIEHDNRLARMIDLTEGVSLSALLDVELPDTNEAGEPLSTEERVEQQKALADMALMARAIMDSAKVEVEATDQTKTIGAWETQKYTLNIAIGGMRSQGEVWATSTAPHIYQAYQRLAYAQMAASPNFERLLEEISKIKGVTVYSRSTMNIMGVDVDVETELLELSNVDAPEGLYELPEEYDVITSD